MTVETADAGTAQHRRATVRPDKAAAVAQIAEAFRSSTAAVLTEYRGLTVKQISDLRVALGADTTYAVVKNTLTKIAAADAGLAGVEALLQGPTAVAFIKGEPVAAAKALRDFAKAHPVLIVKGGVMDGRAITADEIKKLADLESREVLLAKMAGALLASLSNAAALFNAPLVQAARVVGALQAKAEADPSVLAGGAGIAAAVPPTEAPTEESVEDSAPAEVAPTDAAPSDVPVAEATGAPDTTEAADTTEAPDTTA